MDFSEIFNRIVVLWPEEIDISDGYPSGTSGYMFPKFNEISDKIEDSIDYKNDHWGSIGTWSFSQALHCWAKEIHKAGGTTLYTRNVNKQEIDRFIKFNLDGDGWEFLRKQYKGL